MVPKLGMRERGEVWAGHHLGLPRFTVLARRAAVKFREEPHATERDAGTEAGGGFGNEAAAAGAEDAMDLTEDGAAVGDDEEEAGDNDGIYRSRDDRQMVGISVVEAAVLQAAARSTRTGAFDQALGEIDACRTDLRERLSQPAGIEAGTAPQLDDMGSRHRSHGAKEGMSDLLGVVAEEILAAKGIEPGAAVEEAVWGMDRWVSYDRTRHFELAYIHALQDP